MILTQMKIREGIQTLGERVNEGILKELRQLRMLLLQINTFCTLFCLLHMWVYQH